MIEREADWPAALLYLITVVLPKEADTHDPLKQRPVALLCMLYRAWAAAWYRKLADWHEAWLPPGVVGGRRGYGKDHAIWHLALD